MVGGLVCETSLQGWWSASVWAKAMAAFLCEVVSRRGRMPVAQTSVPCLGLESQGSRICAWGPWLLVAIVTGFAMWLIPPLHMSTLVGTQIAVIPPYTLLCTITEPWSLMGPVF